MIRKLSLPLAALAWLCLTVGAFAQAPEAAATAADPTADAPTDGGIDPARLRDAERALARRDPPIARVVAAAVEVSGSDPERAADLASRARLSGLIPSVRAGVRRGQDLSLRIDAEEEGQWSTGDDLSLYGTVTFDLGRLVFAREEVPLLREERDRRAERRELVRAVVALYYERRRLLLERALLGPGDPAQAARIAELGALLNAFTDGAFSRMMVPRR